MEGLANGLTLRWACALPMVDIGTSNLWRLAPDLASARLLYAASVLIGVAYLAAAGFWGAAAVGAALAMVALYVIAGLYNAGSVDAAKALLGCMMLAELVVVLFVASRQRPGIIRRVVLVEVFGIFTEIVCFVLGELGRGTWHPYDRVSVIAQAYGPWASSLQLSVIMLAYLYAVGWSGADGRK